MTTQAEPNASPAKAVRRVAIAPINLVPSRRREARQRARWRNRCIVACSAYALIVAGVAMAARLLAGGGVVIGHDADVAVRLKEAGDRLARSAEALTREQATLTETESLLRASRAMVDQPDWSRLMGLFAAKAENQVMLKGCAVRPREAAGDAPVAPKNQKGPPPPVDPTLLVSLSGMASTQSAASQYALRLEATGLFGRVSLTDTSRELFQGLQLVTFRIECTLADPTAVKPAAPGGPTLTRRLVADGGEP